MTPPDSFKLLPTPSDSFSLLLIPSGPSRFCAQREPLNLWLSAVYSVMAAPEPQAKLEDLLPAEESRRFTIEDWLWHRLCMVSRLLSSSASFWAHLIPSTGLHRALQRAFHDLP